MPAKRRMMPTLCMVSTSIRASIIARSLSKDHYGKKWMSSMVASGKGGRPPSLLAFGTWGLLTASATDAHCTFEKYDKIPLVGGAIEWHHNYFYRVRDERNRNAPV